MRYLELMFLSVLVVLTSSCNRDEVLTTDLPPEIIVPTHSYKVVVGEEVRIAPKYNNADDAIFEWRGALGADGFESSERAVVFSSDNAGSAILYLKVSTSAGSAEATFDIAVNERLTVYDYTPAPGQFIGEVRTAGFSGEELCEADAIEYAENRLANGYFVSLGAFGGSITMGINRPIANHDGEDFAIRGNSFDGSSEPGVVWVMQDENGNGIADDTWYELKGSETGLDTTYQDYEVTYYRPTSSGMAVSWTDNMGGSGTVDYLASFHDQPSYYPTWITADSYTLRGTRLEARNYDKSGNGSMWVQPAYGWGYADNASERDCTDGVNRFDIANAIDGAGESVTLEYIDFVKVQSAVQSKSGWTGELSTEVCGFWEITE